MTIETLEKTKQWVILPRRRGKRRSTSSNEITNIFSSYNRITISAVLFTKVEILISSPYKSARDLLGLSHKCTRTNYWLQHYCSRSRERLWLRYQQCPYCCTTHYKYELSLQEYRGEEVELLIRERQERVGHAPLLAVSQVDCCYAQEWREPSDGVPKPVSRRAGSDERGSLTRQGRAGQSYIKY